MSPKSQASPIQQALPSTTDIVLLHRLPKLLSSSLLLSMNILTPVSLPKYDTENGRFIQSLPFLCFTYDTKPPRFSPRRFLFHYCFVNHSYLFWLLHDERTDDGDIL